jgi:hypothetical protein
MFKRLGQPPYEGLTCVWLFEDEWRPALDRRYDPLRAENAALFWAFSQ